METRADPTKLETPFHRGGTQRLLRVIATVGALGIWWFAKPVVTPSPATPGAETSGFATPLLQVDLNTADTRELSLLPSVGPTLARRIVENRDRLGPFQSLDDLGRVYGIGEKSIAAMREFCTVGHAAGDADVAQRPSMSATLINSR